MQFSYTYTEDFSDDNRDFEYEGSYAVIGFIPAGGSGDMHLEQFKEGDVVTVGENLFVYDGQTVTRMPAESAAFVAIRTLDIFGNEYVSQRFAI